MALDRLPHGADDDRLLARIAGGDRAAFAELFRRRRKDVYGFALHMTGACQVAEDVTQDVFLIVLRDAARYVPGRTRAVSWLCGIARNVARQRLEREHAFLPLDDDSAEQAPGFGAIHPDPVGDLTRAEGIERVRGAVLALPLPYREAVVLCDLQELSYSEAAEALGCPVGTVRSRVHRGRQLLVASLAGRQAEEGQVAGRRRAAR
jgi:RNA polymerase sigma-70 factor (ECF subfamily)